ncbi:hypothetical protein [Actinoallomurus iriomotensis]|uniref:Uncharacterized protein n=1 Tax=Actinoallomurus iriomotensis TaxID=478107 RepID=A0A9W6S8B3_9ACTN|nr:hypothetical protein [Actinoallomurus iriomotensis]GLY87552.1 hypothetical protein Airi02_054810 [Actinoallomurus iriomotensis]
MSTPKPPDNLDLATTAREMADQAPAGSFEKAVAGSVAVTCATTRTYEEAIDVLGGIQPVEVRRPAIEFLKRLALAER